LWSEKQIGYTDPVVYVLGPRAHPEEAMVKNPKQTSSTVASKASKILRGPKETKTEKSVAGSALSQTPSKKKGRG
jgi:hypothetical protein